MKFVLRNTRARTFVQSRHYNTVQIYQNLPEQKPPVRISLVIPQLRMGTEGVFKRKLQDALKGNGHYFTLFLTCIANRIRIFSCSLDSE